MDIDLYEVTEDAWKGHNDLKLPWDKDPFFVHMLRLGMDVDNLVSIANSREGLRMRRLMGPPFARKFLLDPEYLFKECTKRRIEVIKKLTSENDGVIDINRQHKLFALDIISIEFYSRGADG